MRFLCKTIIKTSMSKYWIHGARFLFFQKHHILTLPRFNLFYLKMITSKLIMKHLNPGIKTQAKSTSWFATTLLLNLTVTYTVYSKKTRFPYCTYWVQKQTDQYTRSLELISHRGLQIKWMSFKAHSIKDSQFSKQMKT